jgi:hypothetical protein
MKDIKRDDEQIDEIIKKYDNILIQEKIIDDLIRKWGPVLDKLPDE